MPAQSDAEVDAGHRSPRIGGNLALLDRIIQHKRRNDREIEGGSLDLLLLRGDQSVLQRQRVPGRAFKLWTKLPERRR